MTYGRIWIQKVRVFQGRWVEFVLSGLIFWFILNINWNNSLVNRQGKETVWLLQNNKKERNEIVAISCIVME